MRTSVTRLDPDPDRTLSAVALAHGIAALTEQGIDLHTRRSDRDLELIADAVDADAGRRRTVEACRVAFGVEPAVASVTLVSRGTDADARAVLDAFGLQARVERPDDEPDVAVVTLPGVERRRIPESRLHTALEAALNCEVHLRFEA